MDLLSRRLYNGGFNHLKRRTLSLLVRMPRAITQPALARPMSMPHHVPLVNTNKTPEDGHACKGIHSYLNSSRRDSSTLSTTPTSAAMPAHTDFVENNAQYAAAFGEKGALPLKPGKKLAIVTCMDARINVYAELGINEGDAHIIRNAGGSAKDALRSIIISQRLLGTREIAVFHHTDCGMLTFNTPQLRKLVKDSDPDNAALKAVDDIDFLEFSELEQSVREDVQYLKESPLVLPETLVTGWVYEVGTGKIRRIV
ncbi:carbonic anhydrase [Phanerochaete sordida]|uniref:Carbonic anhydrase n=1 Tax=Phanerochaete sordida TaxID=48140 RepID=A0A9P3L9N6_9APHY|nr:carbonic anhydrase [Phanerochaete sordida]